MKKKNRLLKQIRGIGFEEVVMAINERKVVDDFRHPNSDRYRNQRVMIVIIKQYAYVVPYVSNENGIFLKTIFPDRRYTKKYLKKK